MNDPRFFFRIGFVSLLPFALFYSGCLKSEGEVSRPEMVTEKENSGPVSEFLDIQGDYNDRNYSRALQKLSLFLQKNPKHPEALFYKGLLALRIRDYDSAKEAFSAIDNSGREGLLEACSELKSVYSEDKQEESAKLVKAWFSDCFSELHESLEVEILSDFSKEKIMNLGALYDEAISGVSDEEIKKRKEEEFLKHHNLSREELVEITSKYLEYLAVGAQ